MSTIKTIGRFFAEEWQQALQNIDPFFTPVPTTSTTIDELQSIAKTLQSLIDYWVNQVYSNTSEEAMLNAQAIADLQQSKLDEVNRLLALKDTAGEAADIPMQTTGSGTASMMPILLLGGGVAALYLLNKKKNVSGMNKNNLLLLLLIGGGAYLYYQSKQQQPEELPGIAPGELEPAPAIVENDPLINDRNLFEEPDMMNPYDPIINDMKAETYNYITPETQA